jgi:NAD(P)-dependent dehydrogenase (short-subunit alcohol dehydrogenase family)
MVEAKYGRIISMSSISAIGNRGQVNYSTAKAGLQGLTKTLAIELGPFGVTVNSIAPGFIETAMTKATAERLGSTIEAMRADVASTVPVRRGGVPADVANARRNPLRPYPRKSAAAPGGHADPQLARRVEVVDGVPDHRRSGNPAAVPPAGR